ncbi:YfjP family GTPase [Streptomyces abikoensis]|uniref:YfjP family GTPase n=1 Tax=Streptomyces abikoensis TaxID=97398 RepID=UPI001673F0AF|nr:YfjP family GTPase [Streptomyces abikoensis]
MTPDVPPCAPPKNGAEGGGGRKGADGDRYWYDGVIARRVRPEPAPRPGRAAPLADPSSSPVPRVAAPPSPVGLALRPRLDALRELVGLSRARLDRHTLAEASRVLDEAAARHRHSLDLTVVAIAGATGSGKSTLFNALARAQLSEAGVRRPTTALPVSCAWSDRAEGLLDRLGIPARARRTPVRPYDPALAGLVLLDLPDHDSAAAGHREQVDRLLALVDAVIWVVDPEKYADAVLHERYLRPLAGYAEVTFVVLNQVDRLSADGADQVLDDLRRLLDEDGLALGEYGEPGASVMALSALTGAGVGELREALGTFVARRNAAELRLTADVNGVSARLRPAYVTDVRPGLTERARQEFEDRLAEAVGAQAAGLAAERAWRREAERACGTTWTRLRFGYERCKGLLGLGSGGRAALDGDGHDTGGRGTGGASAPRRTASRPLVEQAVRTLAYEASAGLPGPWALAVREAAGRGAEGLAEALDAVAAASAPALVPGTRRAGGRPPGGVAGADGGRTGVWPTDAEAGGGLTRGGAGARMVRPRWWAAVAAGQGALSAFQLMGLAWLVGAFMGEFGGPWWVPVVLVSGGGVGGPVLAWCGRLAARGPARGYGLETEHRLRSAAAGCGRARVLEPVAAELLRYREVRAQFVIAAGEG